MNLFDAEMKLMEIIWKEGDITAKALALIANEKIGWSKATTYTMITRCVTKKAIERIEPYFVCRALITREQVQDYRSNELIEEMYGGSADKLIAALIGKKRLSKEELINLKNQIDALE